MIVKPLRTRIFRRGDRLPAFIAEALPREHVREGLILAVTSKIVSLAENRLVAKDSIAKRDLVRREADVFLGALNHGYDLTIKHGLLIPSAGIDESNSETGDYILYPEDPFASAEKLWRELRALWSVQNLGVLITDSHTTPLRRGVSGVCLSYWGFGAVASLIGAPDLFGRQLTVTQLNLADGLAASAVMLMGEGNDARPLATIENAPVEFRETIDRRELEIPLEDDLFAPLLATARARD